MTIGGRAGDQRWWLLAAVVAMASITVVDRIGGDRFRAPVGSVIVGPMIAAIACAPLAVGALVGVAMVLRIVLDVTDSSIPVSQTGFSLSMLLLLGIVAVGASVVRRRRERELAAARPAQRLTTLAAALAAARSVEEVEKAFDVMARTELGATATRFTLPGEPHEPGPAGMALFSSDLRIASGDLGRVDIWFAAPPLPDVLDVLEQAIPQAAVGLSRSQAAHSLEVTARRLGALQRSTSQLAGLLRTDDIARAMVVEARRALQADGACILSADVDATRVLAVDAGAGSGETDSRVVPLGSHRLVAAIRSGELIVDAGPPDASLSGPADDRRVRRSSSRSPAGRVSPPPSSCGSTRRIGSTRRSARSSARSPR